jgi:hypothetical protein
MRDATANVNSNDARENLSKTQRVGQFCAQGWLNI